MDRSKYFVFSDESGSWHDPRGVYVRSWIIVPESEHIKLIEAVSYVISELGCAELKWRTLAANPRYFDLVSKFDFRIFLTLSSPGDINWEEKYRITRDFPNQIQNLDFGELDEELVSLLKKKMFDDIKNILFLKFYERTHITNAKKGIDRVLPARENELIYRVDQPQMSKDGWKNILQTLAPGVQIEFPKSQSDEGIQFADIIAGCIRSFIEKDDCLTQAEILIPKFRDKLIKRDPNNPNPNLIFFDEIRETIKSQSARIWTV